MATSLLVQFLKVSVCNCLQVTKLLSSILHSIWILRFSVQYDACPFFVNHVLSKPRLIYEHELDEIVMCDCISGPYDRNYNN